MGNEVFTMLLRAQKDDKPDISMIIVGNNTNAVKIYPDNNLIPTSPTYMPIRRIKVKGYKISSDNTVIFNDTDNHETKIYLKDKSKNILGNFNSIRAKYISSEVIETLYNECFKDNKTLTTLNLPNLKNIQTGSLRNCTIRGTITIPIDGTFGDYPFDKSNIDEIIILNNATTLGLYGTYIGFASNCNNLTKVVLPNTLKIISAYSFYSDKQLENINVPTSITDVNTNAFYNCTKLRSFNISNTAITTLSNFCFNKSGLSGVFIIPETCTNIGIDIFAYTYITKLIIRSPITEIKDTSNDALNGFIAFNGELTEVELPNTITRIGSSAFQKCNKLTTINCPQSLNTIGNKAFYYDYALTEFDFSNIMYIGKYAFNYTCIKQSKNYTDILDLTNVIQIDNTAFSNCKITNLKLNPNLTTLPESTNLNLNSGVFSNNLLKSIDFGNNSQLTHIGARCFELNYALNLTSLPNNLIHIGAHAFEYTDLSNLNELPDSVEYIGDYAFNKSNYYINKFPANLKYLGKGSLNYKNNVHYNIPDGITSLSGPVFSGGVTESGIFGISSIDLGINLTTINSIVDSYGNIYSIFNRCKQLSKVILHDKVTFIDSNCFYNNTITLICYATTPPELVNASMNTNSIIYVPDKYVNTYKTATNWSVYANNIKPLSEYSE